MAGIIRRSRELSVPGRRRRTTSPYRTPSPRGTSLVLRRSMPVAVSSTATASTTARCGISEERFRFAAATTRASAPKRQRLRGTAALGMFDDVPTTAGCDGDSNRFTPLDQAAATCARNFLPAKHLDYHDLVWSSLLTRRDGGLSLCSRNRTLVARTPLITRHGRSQRSQVASARTLVAFAHAFPHLLM